MTRRVGDEIKRSIGRWGAADMSQSPVRTHGKGVYGSAVGIVIGVHGTGCVAELTLAGETNRSGINACRHRPRGSQLSRRAVHSINIDRLSVGVRHVEKISGGMNRENSSGVGQREWRSGHRTNTAGRGIYRTPLSLPPTLYID